MVLASSTVKRPPVAGIRATSPICVLKVERSSWANCCVVSYVFFIAMFL